MLLYSSVSGLGGDGSSGSKRGFDGDGHDNSGGGSQDNTFMGYTDSDIPFDHLQKGTP